MNTINHLYPSTVPKRQLIQIFSALIVSCLMIDSTTSLAEETNQPSPAPIVSLPDTNYLEILHTLAGLADQIRSNQVAIELNGKDAKEASARNAELLSGGLQSMQ